MSTDPAVSADVAATLGDDVSQRLDAWLYGTRIATLTRGRRTGGIDLAWCDQALERWGYGSRIVSSLLPLGESAHPVAVKAFLDGYLPEDRSRVHHAVEAGVSWEDTFGLIRAYGRDLAGALIIVPEGADTASSEARYEPIDVAEIAVRLRRASQHTGRLDARDSFSSLPGMVPKVLLHRETHEAGGDQWYACRGGAPSTWIVKRSHDHDGPAADVIDTEVLALACARRLDLTVVEAEVVTLDEDLRAIAVRRYDRVRRQDGTFGRIHQEDLAQALGLNTSDANRKFQRGKDQLPSLATAAAVLTDDGTSPHALLRLMVFNHLIGNTDMHAKNISYLHLLPGRTIVAPVYDCSMHLHAPSSGKVAIQVNGKEDFVDIGFGDLLSEAVSWGMPRQRAADAIASLSRDFLRALQEEYDGGRHPGVPDAAWTTVFERSSALLDQADGPRA